MEKDSKRVPTDWDYRYAWSIGARVVPTAEFIGSPLDDLPDEEKQAMTAQFEPPPEPVVDTLDIT